MTIVTLGALLLLAYTYVGYPLLLWLCARFRRDQAPRVSMQPRVSILVIAYNEERFIVRKLKNLLRLQYPRELLEIVLASDASTDTTVARAFGLAAAGIKVIAFGQRRGKPAILNELMPTLSGEIVVLMDARQRIDPGAVQALVAAFADAAVGAVSGELHLRAGGGVNGVGFYWAYEKFIRRQESRLASTVGVTGALYALRRSLYQPIPVDTLLDDVLVPMQVVRQGYRVLFEPAAIAWDKVSATPGIEFDRKVRTIAGNVQLFMTHRWLLNPFTNPLWIQTISHKLLRLLGPLLLVLLLLGSILLRAQPLFQALLLLQAGFYTAALVAQLFPEQSRRWRWLSVPHAFCLLNWSALMGLVRFMRGRQQVTWQKAG